MASEFDAVLVVSFGGPEKSEEVMPFLENVTKGRGIPRERLLGVAEHYYHFGGKSPINEQNRELIAALRGMLAEQGPRIPVFWGNRNWHPFLADTLLDMREAGVRRAAAFITSAFGSYSGCRQYMEDIARARAEVGEGAPEVLPLPLFYDNPGFLDPTVDNIRTALSQFPAPPHLAFTAHSVPVSMTVNSPYVAQLEATCAKLAARLGHADWKLLYQSRSGPPSQPWLEPDVIDYIRQLHAQGVRDLVIAPIGFISDHMEVIYDLDTEAAALCSELGLRMVRAKTVGAHPKFVRMIRDLLGQERVCALGCCPKPMRPPVTASGPPEARTGRSGD